MKSIFLVSLFGALAAGGSLVVPGANAGTEGPGSISSVLFGPKQYASMLYLPPSLLTGLNIGDQITGLQFRLDSSASGPASTLSLVNFGIVISEPLAGFTHFVGGTAFVFYEGSNFVPVRGGGLTISPNDYPGGGSPNPFGPVISFDQPYPYASTTGLMVYIDQYNATGPDLVVDASGGQTGGLFVSGNAIGDFGLITGDAGSDLVPIIQFQTSGRDVAVPEPGMLGMIGLGVIFLGWAEKRRKS